MTISTKPDNGTHPWTPLISKYDNMGPRYTSYPTALQFNEDFRQQEVIDAVEKLPKDYPVSLYIHIPFCQNICFYCACNKVITKHKNRAEKYLQYLVFELTRYAELLAGRPVKQIHFGGGTPNFLKSEQLCDLVSFIRQTFNVTGLPELDLSIEIDPRYADATYIEELRASGFNRLSFGVQDLQPDVQIAVNRVCSIEHIEYLLNSARELDYASIHVDLIYGLPYQTIASFKQTIAEITRLRPDRLSIFNYAHLPHRFTPQRRIKLKDLPTAQEKLDILHNSIDYLTEHGYSFIGMDHFALTDSPLAKLQQAGKLHRNFQGYTTHGECALIGIGVSAISQIGNVYKQNFRNLEDYYSALDAEKPATWRGYQMHLDDEIRRSLIMQLICHGSLDIPAFEKQWNLMFFEYFKHEYIKLEQQQNEGLLNINVNSLKVTETGWLLIRNICMVFDAYIDQFLPEKNFSRAI